MHDIDRTQFAVRDREAEGALGPAAEVMPGEGEGELGSLFDTLRRTGRQGADWVMIRLALARGITDERQLTDMLFHARHPDRAGRPLQAGERQLVQEWLQLRDQVVRPALAAPAGPGGPGGPAPTHPAGAPAPAGPAPGGGPATPTLDALRPLVGPATAATVPNAVAILRPLAGFWGIPWQLPFTILQHEGGIRLFSHHDGVMQTIAAARKTVLPKLPRPLKLVLLELPPTDPTPDSALTEALHREFPRRLAVQIAAGTQELVTVLQRFNGYVALAFVGYNAGAGSAHWVATGRSATSKPRLTGDDWERACRVGATLLHQPPAAVNVPQGVWQCDANLAVAGRPGTGWYRKFAVRDKRTNRLLIAYQYLRSVRSCIRHERPGVPCGWSNHKQQQEGSGRLDCEATRIGALDKLFDPARFPSPYRDVAQAHFQPIADDGAPLKVVGGQLTKVAPAIP